MNTEEGTEPDVAIVLGREPVGFDTATSPDAFGRIFSRESGVVDGREAVAVVADATGSGLRERGTLSYTWVVDLAKGAFVASTHDRPDVEFQEFMDVLDLMVPNLRFEAPAPDDGDGVDRGDGAGDVQRS